MTHVLAKGRETYQTQNYAAFKRLVGNRNLHEGDIKSIAATMMAVGWIGAPIIVNEHMEIIDGQNRFEAAKIAGIDVLYQICQGYGISECIILNINSRAWRNRDYVSSFAERGVDSYVWLMEVYKEANTPKKYISMDDITCLAYCRGKSVTGNDKMRKLLKEGSFSIDAAGRQATEDAIKFLKPYFAIFKKIGGRQDPLYNAVLYCRNNGIDEDRLFEKVFQKNWMKFTKNSSIGGFLITITDIYNAHIRQESKKIHMYDDYCNERNKIGLMDQE